MAAATGGRLVGPDVDIDGASFDSRTLTPGQLFVAIVAERDGHEFVPQALAAGAAAYLTSRPAQGGTAIEVADTAHALMALAAWARGRVPDRVVGITGSVGKTSTKDLVAAALAPRWRVWANERSFNNAQGLPVTILGAPDDTEALVLEMGMRGFGEIRALCEVARPTIGVVTSVGMAHTERVGGIDGVATAKRELVEAIPAAGTAVLNADDDRVAAMRTACSGAVVTYGVSSDADVRIDGIVLDATSRPSFGLRTPWGDADVRLDVSGAHMAHNAAAAIAVAGVTGVPLDDAVSALGAATLSPMRMHVRRASSGAIVVDDTYNANPVSMVAALDALAAIDADRRIAVLGQMAELDDPVSAHADVARHAADLGITIVAVGTALYGPEPSDDPVGVLGVLGPRDAVLFKASRVARLERFVAEVLDAAR